MLVFAEPSQWCWNIKQLTMYSLDCPLHSKWIYQESDNMSLTVQYTVICIHFNQHVVSHSWFLKNHQTETAKSKIYSFITLPNFSRFEFLHPLILNVVLSLECLELCNTVGDIRRVLRVQTSSPPLLLPQMHLSDQRKIIICLVI